MDLVHTYKSILSSHKPCSQLILTELRFFFLPLLSLPRWTWLAFSHFTTSQPMAVSGNKADEMLLCITQDFIWKNQGQIKHPPED